jgi:hypothetical protein
MWGTVGNDIAVNLYDVYKRNFENNVATIPPPLAGHSYKSSEGASVVTHYGDFVNDPAGFHYVVSDYDPNVIDIVSISPVGLMTYKPIASSPPPPEAYINIILIKK